MINADAVARARLIERQLEEAVRCYRMWLISRAAGMASAVGTREVAWREAETRYLRTSGADRGGPWGSRELTARPGGSSKPRQEVTDVPWDRSRER